MEDHQKVEMQNKARVEVLYKALLGQGTMDNVAKLLASDLEWWFHGPPQCHHMMKVLTGETDHTKGFRFEPKQVTAIGDCVIAEGWEGKAYWVHVWPHCPLFLALIVPCRAFQLLPCFASPPFNDPPCCEFFCVKFMLLGLCFRKWSH